MNTRERETVKTLLIAAQLVENHRLQQILNIDILDYDDNIWDYCDTWIANVNAVMIKSGLDAESQRKQRMKFWLPVVIATAIGALLGLLLL